MGIQHAICSTASKVWTGIKASSPTILVISGTIGLAAAGVIACIETHKHFDAILAEHRETVKSLKDIRDGVVTIKDCTTEEYAKKYYKKDLTHAWLTTLCKYAKAYAPALIFAALGTVCVLSGHKILSNRHLAAVAEAGLFKQTLSEYRKRVAEAVGDEKEKLLYLGGDKAMISDKEVDPETGEVKETLKEAIVGDEVPLSWTYIISKDTVNDALYGISDNDCMRRLRQIVDNANQYFTRHDQISLHTMMSHWWTDDYMKNCPETSPNGWVYNDQFVAEGRDIQEAIKYDVKVLSADPDNRKYAVTFNVQGNIVNALLAEKKAKKMEKKARKVHATVRPALA